MISPYPLYLNTIHTKTLIKSHYHKISLETCYSNQYTNKLRPNLNFPNLLLVYELSCESSEFRFEQKIAHTFCNYRDVHQNASSCAFSVFLWLQNFFCIPRICKVFHRYVFCKQFLYTIYLKLDIKLAIALWHSNIHTNIL